MLKPIDNIGVLGLICKQLKYFCVLNKMLNTKFLESTKGILDLNSMEAIEVIACIPMALVAHEQSLYTF